MHNWQGCRLQHDWSSNRWDISSWYTAREYSAQLFYRWPMLHLLSVIEDLNDFRSSFCLHSPWKWWKTVISWCLKKWFNCAIVYMPFLSNTKVLLKEETRYSRTGGLHTSLRNGWLSVHVCLMWLLEISCLVFYQMVRDLLISRLFHKEEEEV